jgi:hypothetical protein
VRLFRSATAAGRAQLEAETQNRERISGVIGRRTRAPPIRIDPIDALRII